MLAKCPPCKYWLNVRWLNVRWLSVRWLNVRWLNIPVSVRTYCTCPFFLTNQSSISSRMRYIYFSIYHDNFNVIIRRFCAFSSSITLFSILPSRAVEYQPESRSICSPIPHSTYPIQSDAEDGIHKMISEPRNYPPEKHKHRMITHHS